MTCKHKAVGEGDARVKKLHICSFTTHDDLLIDVRGRQYRFEFSDRFGPLLLGKRGEPISARPRQDFLEAVTQLVAAGRSH